jgi:hypothetical protein
MSREMRISGFWAGPPLAAGVADACDAFGDGGGAASLGSVGIGRDFGFFVSRCSPETAPIAVISRVRDVPDAPM